jgi:phage FluMu protein Com
LTGTAPTPAPAPPPAELRCRCGRVLGTADGAALILGGVRVFAGRRRLGLEIQCPDCRAVRRYCLPAYKPRGPC